jgi:hypothetical protein
MMRNLIVLGCSALLALALGVTSYGGTAVDTDADGVVDPVDNCRVDPNGPNGGACMAQQDGDGDGFGNGCDTDINNNGQTDLSDVNATLTAAGASSTDLTFDFNCNGQADLSDVTTALVDAGASAVPGPSCSHPNGTPCP